MTSSAPRDLHEELRAPPSIDESAPTDLPQLRAPGRSVPFVPEYHDDEDSEELVG